ncbi:PsbP-related protein [Cohnella suwonensis]|uniref:PsbP-related protein n=1 Tax=Cohnella suwonensis TaxID=696072 RepID=A0ABW0LXU7_9BACL
MRNRQPKNGIKIAFALGVLALALSACGGNDKKEESSPSPSASASPSASVAASPSASPSESPSASAASPSSASEAGSTGMQHYKGELTSIDYPSDWTLVENVGGAVAAFMSPKDGDDDKFQENVNVVVQDLEGQDVTLEQYAQITKDQIGQLITDAEMIGEESMDADDGTKLYSLLYSGNQGEFNLNWQQVFTIVDGKAYILTYTAEPDQFDKYVETVGTMADTWIFGGQ